VWGFVALIPPFLVGFRLLPEAHYGFEPFKKCNEFQLPQAPACGFFINLGESS
jgi:hypothetical protein